MAKHWRYFIFLIWISYLIIAGVLLFTRGFLLSREAFTDTSKCTSENKIPCTPSVSTSINITNGHEFQCSQENKLSSLFNDIPSASKVCLPAQSRVILMIIDALRYDFTEFDETLDSPMPFQNNLPIINQMLNKHKDRTRLFKFIADPPTTTMQRLKALTTGSLPTFIDAGSNFATPEINEDNLIDQMVQNNKTVVFMGDDTWVGLYPKRFKRCWNFPSFNVWDLDSVDNGIIDNIYSEIPKQDWNLLVAHFLGVDHCGHRYGPNHSEMRRKLKEMNEAIKDVINTMDDRTMLFVIGDHGMTRTGDHGGDSEVEVTSAMFVYSPTPLNSFEKLDSVKQIDLIPTLSSILGIPVPFSNLGSVIFDAIPIMDQKDSLLTNWQLSLLSLWSNVQQTTNYIKTYSERTNQFSPETLEILGKKYNKLSSKVNEVKSEMQFIQFASESKEYLMFVREMCEDVWVQFDSFSMTRGLLLSFLTLFFTYLIIDGIPSKKLSGIFMGSFIFCSYFAVFTTAAITIVLYYLSIVETVLQNVLFSTGMVSVFMLAILVVQHWEDIAINWYECIKVRSWLDTFSRVILLLILCTLFSNSYVVEEAGVFSYLLLTIISVIIYCTNSKPTQPKQKLANLSILRIKWGSVKFKLIIMALTVGVLLRFSMYYWRCREEQKWCLNFSSVENLGIWNKTTDTTNCVFSLIFLAFFATVTRIWLRSCGNLVGFSPTVSLTRYAPSVIVVCTGGFWILHRLPKETKNRIITPWQTDVLAWIVYFLTSVSILCAVIQPLCVYVLPRKKETVSVYGQENIIPQLFNHVKESLQEKRVSGTKETPIVCGLATVYSALYVIVSVFVCLLIALLLGNVLAPSAVIMYFTIAIVLAILAIAQYEKSSNIAQLFVIPNSSVLCWVLLSLYFFYGTGHQPTFPSIQWDAAFIGTGGTFVHNAIPALLIGLNTFCSFIVMGLLLPLLIIAPFTLYVMFPTLCNKQQEKDMSKGELLLYENEDTMYNNLLTVCSKYIMCHGIRMFSCMLAATIHCRHLMVWKIFAPKLIFEALGVLVTLPCVLLGYLLFIRVSSRVDKLITSIDKQNR